MNQQPRPVGPGLQRRGLALGLFFLQRPALLEQRLLFLGRRAVGAATEWMRCSMA
jgi:hypothetical protein